MKIKFTKMQAFGNDYVYIETIDQDLSNIDLNKLAIRLSDHHFGIGSDGMILICPSTECDFRMRVFDPDGTECEMCGNALRSVSKYVYDHKYTDKTEFTIETLAGTKHVWLTIGDDGLATNIRANIGNPGLKATMVPVVTELDEFIDQPVDILDRTFNMTALSWGNPHVAMYIDSVGDLDIEKYGPAIENKLDLFPNRTNVTFVEFVDRDNIKIREWERGTGETIGCGTGCATAVVAGVLTGRCNRKVTVSQIGGPLYIEWDEVSGDLYMTGPSHTVFESEIEVNNL